MNKFNAIAILGCQKMFGSEDEFPESIEEIEKEIEELEKVEVEIEEEPKKKRRAEYAPREKSFRLASVLWGFLVMFLYFFVLNISIMLKMGVDVSGELMNTIYTVLLTQLLFPNTIIATITNNMDIFIGGQGTLVSITIILVAVYQGFFYMTIGTSDMYVVLILVGLIPYMLAGIVAGRINRDPGYGFIAGVLVWLLSLILGLVVVISGVTGLPISLIDVATEIISCGWLSAIFISVFGALGGAGGE